MNMAFKIMAAVYGFAAAILGVGFNQPTLSSLLAVLAIACASITQRHEHH